MARITAAHRLEEANEVHALEYFERALSSLRDPRRRQGLRYPLRTVVVTALMAMVCGCDDAESMALNEAAPRRGWCFLTDSRA